MTSVSSREPKAFLLVAILAAAIATFLYLTGGQGVFHDAYNYYVLAQLISAGGLFGYAIGPTAIGPYFPLLLEVKPNGYPLFISVVALFSTFESDGLHLIVFAVQLIIYVLVCRFAAARIGRIFDSRPIEIGVFAATALNPLLLIQTTEMLSDLLSAVLILLAVAIALPAPPRTPGSRKALWLSFLVAGLATIVRSANVAVLGAVTLIWLLRWWRFREVVWRAAPAAALVAILPFVPQVVNNYLAFGSTSPFVARNEYASDLDFGARTLKYLTSVDPNEKTQWIYANPFLPPGTTTATEFVGREPGGYAATLALHVFTVLDQDYPFPYLTSLRPWYRWPSSIANYVFLGLSGLGLYAGLRRNKWSDHRGFAFVVITIACAACLAIYVPPHVENRYSLPVYPLLGLPFVFGVRWVVDLVRQRHMRSVGVFAAGAIVFIGGCVALSAWVSGFLRPLF